MQKIKGYQYLEKIYESNRSLVYRALRENNKQPVILKILNKEYATPEEISKFSQEFRLISKFDNEGVIQVYELSKVDNSPVIVMEDIDGKSFADILKSKKLRLNEFLNLAIRISEIIGNIHKHNIIHKDINPSNIIWNTKEDILRIIDFGIATELSLEITSKKNPDLLEGTLAYISPEQTGRMNRSIDYRTDFYSLGITFYEMLSGRLPFESTDLLKLMHSHIAVQPASLHEIDENIPQVLSAIVMKLIAKNAEDRYLNAYGIKADLEHCYQELQDTGKINAFELSLHDVSDKFQIPQKLYGREEEIETLMSAFERVREETTELMLVSGFAGIGKSVLINEIRRPVVQHNGYFISGKFEKFKKEVPYSAIIQAFTEFGRQILAENESEITLWKEKILSVLRPNGKIITDIIPVFELIIGKQPDIPVLGPVESKNRFNLVFQEFIKALAGKDHPIVIFLDDLQWADLASLHLLKLFTTNSDIKHIFLIGAYRHNETPDSHPLILIVDEMRKTAATVNTIFLQPLKAEHVSQLLGVTFNRSIEETISLAELLISKTKGNPFFINEFLKSLYKESLIKFSFENGWSWDMRGIKERQATDNVVELMTGKITDLPENSQEVLKLGACIGSYFDLGTMAAISGKTGEDILPALKEVLQEGMLNRIDDIYRFSHDRIQEAVYSLIPVEERKQQHYRIGKLELDNTEKDKLPEKLFYIVHHLNIGLDLFQEESEKLFLAELNLKAGKRALDSNAYASALNYFKTGIGLLAEQCWQEHYDFTHELYQKATRAAQLSANYDTMDTLAEEIFQHARSMLDTIKVYETKIHACMARNQLLEGIRIGLGVLRKLGLKLPEKPGKLRIINELLLIKFSLLGKSVENLFHLPEMKDPYKLAAIQILAGISSSTYYAAPKLYPLISLSAVRLSIKYGNSMYSPYFYAGFGVFHCGVLGNINTGYKYGKLALNLVEKFNIRDTKSKVRYVVSFMINHWKKPFRELADQLLEAYKGNLETGDHEFAALSILEYIVFLLSSGTELMRVEKELVKYGEVIRKLNQDLILKFQLMLHQTLLNAMGMSEDPRALTGLVHDKNKMLAEHKKENYYVIFILYFNLLLSNYRFAHYGEALRNAEMAELYLEAAVSTLYIPEFFFHDSLTRLALYPAEKESIQKKLLKRVSKNQKKMKKWAFHAPMNYGYKYYLVEAEIARVRGQKLKAIDLYKRAVQLTHENKLLHEEALAYELYAKFWLGIDEKKIAALYMTEAHYKYSIWGAAAIVKYIEKQYGDLLKSRFVVKTGQDSISIKTSGISSSLANIDLLTVIKTSQTFSSEIDLNRLLKEIMRFSFENAGAQRGFLIIQDGENKNLYIEAEGEVEKEIKVLKSVPVEKNNTLSSTIINYVDRTGENVVLNNAHKEGNFINDPYIKDNEIKSLLCIPITYKGKTSGILYLENNLVVSAFTKERLVLLKILSSQAAISIENARLYENLEKKVAERTAQLAETNKNLKELSLNDPLTSLHNRRYVYEFVSELSENFIKDQIKLLNNGEKRDLEIKNKVLGVYLIDIDHFKKVNDTYGHKAGDTVLVKMSTVLKKMIRGVDTVVRWGGEEFLIILNNTKPEYLKVFSKKILNTISKTPLKLKDATIYKTCSIGCTKIPMNEKTPDLLTLEQTINLSDFALYKAKENGRNQAVHIELTNPDNNVDENIKKYILNLSKYKEIDSDFINLQYVKPGDN